jgi:AcrR family transcriptional regulator
MEKTVARIVLHVEKSSSRERLLDAALQILGREGSGGLRVRAVEDAAGLPHGSVRHHLGDRAGLVRALFDHLATADEAAAPAPAAPGAALAQWLGPGRTLTLARYELFLLAARDPELRAPLIEGRARFEARAAALVGAAAAPLLVVALDGLMLDALVRGTSDAQALQAAAAKLTRALAG